MMMLNTKDQQKKETRVSSNMNKINNSLGKIVNTRIMINSQL